MRFSRRTRWASAHNDLTTRLAAARASGRELVNLTVSNPTKAAFPYPTELADLATWSGPTYSPAPFGSMAAREAVCSGALAGVSMPENLVLTACTSDGYGYLFKTLADAGDNVLVPQPGYPLIDYLAELEGLEVRHYHLLEADGWRLDLPSLSSHIDDRTRAIVVVSPNNPTGSIIASTELDALERLCLEHDLALIVDEVFAAYPIDPAPDALETCAGDRRALTFVLGGLSKFAGLPGAKLSWIAVHGPSADVEGALVPLELVCDTYLATSSFVQTNAGALIAATRPVREAIRVRIADNARHAAALQVASRTWSAAVPQAGWSLVIRVPSVMTDLQWALTLLDKHGVVVHPGYLFEFGAEHYLVVSLLVQQSIFRNGLAKISGAVSDVVSGKNR